MNLEQQLKKIEKQLQKKIQDALNNEVKEVVVETLLSHVKTDIYDDYPNPRKYERRYDDGGLADERNIISVVKGNTLSVENVTMSNEEYLPDGKSPFKIAGVIEYGSGQYGEYDYYDLGDRPFLEETRKDLSTNGQHIKAMKSGLKRQNIDVK